MALPFVLITTSAFDLAGKYAGMDYNEGDVHHCNAGKFEEVPEGVPSVVDLVRFTAKAYTPAVIYEREAQVMYFTVLRINTIIRIVKTIVVLISACYSVILSSTIINVSSPSSFHGWLLVRCWKNCSGR